METLERFANAHGITYPLLSDLGSKSITDLGILNITLAQERAAYNRPIEDRHQGIPYPGSFFIDEEGLLVAKRFEQSHRIRPSTNTLLRELGGVEGSAPKSAAEDGSPGVRVGAWLDTDVLYANQLQEVNIRIEMEDGVHLYTDPVPDGFRALKVSASGDNQLRPEPVHIPPGHDFQVEGLPEAFSVLEGTLDLKMPFIVVSNRDTAGDDPRPVVLNVEIEYQACTGQECFMPEKLVLHLPLTEHPNPGYETIDRAALSPLAIRRLVEGPKGEGELLGLVNAALVGNQISAETLSDLLGDLQKSGIVSQDLDGSWATL